MTQLIYIEFKWAIIRTVGFRPALKTVVTYMECVPPCSPTSSPATPTTGIATTNMGLTQRLSLESSQGC